MATLQGEISQGWLTIYTNAEKASIDEAYLDLTETVRLKILENNPHLRTLPKGASLSDAPPNPPVFVWKDLELAVPVIPPQEAESRQENLSTEAKFALRWRAYALHLTSEIMQECRKQVREQLGYTCSAGIASTKVCKDYPVLRKLESGLR